MILKIIELLFILDELEPSNWQDSFGITWIKLLLLLFLQSYKAVRDIKIYQVIKATVRNLNLRTVFSNIRDKAASYKYNIEADSNSHCSCFIWSHERLERQKVKFLSISHNVQWKSSCTWLASKATRFHIVPTLSADVAKFHSVVV